MHTNNNSCYWFACLGVFLCLASFNSQLGGATATAYSGDTTVDTIGITITQQPLSQFAYEGSSVTLAVSAIGATSLYYQWYKDGILLSGQNNSTLPLSNLKVSDSKYIVMVSNLIHKTFSLAATIHVLGAPPSCVQISRLPLPFKSPGKDSLVVVTHGWTSKELNWSLPADDAWVTDMASEITNRCSANWVVQPVYWTKESWTILPDTALFNAAILGALYGRSVSQQGWQHIHLLAKSAGAGFIQAAANEIRQNSPSTVIHTTFLDPFLSSLRVGVLVYGMNASWSDCYMAFDVLTGPYTYGRLVNAHNVDVTLLDPIAMVNPKAPTAGHDWPRKFYENTITNTLLPSDYYGFPLSKEGGGWNRISLYPANNFPTVLGPPELAAQLAAAMAKIGKPIVTGATIAFDTITKTVSSMQNVMVNNAGLFLTTALFALPIARANDAVIAGNNIELGPTNQLGDPAWISMGIEVTNNINFVKYDACFISSNSAEGVLTVFWGTNQIGMIDERVVQPGITTYQIGLPGTYTNGLYSLNFRLEQFSSAPSSLIITNVAFGFIGVTNPISLAVGSVKTNSSIVFNLTGASNQTYLIQSSTTLTNWEPASLIVNSNGTVVFEESFGTNSNQRFYRAVIP